MAIYHLTTKLIRRSQGQSAVAAAAYRAGDELWDEQLQKLFHYSRRHGVDQADIVLPSLAQHEWAKDRETLWNAAEHAGRHPRAQVARELELALPHELTSEQRVELTREFAQRLADTYGIAVDYAIHSPGKEGDHRNWHAHLLMTTRVIGPEKLDQRSDLEIADWQAKQRGLPTARERLRAIREAWTNTANRHLERAGREERIDHRSLAAQGIHLSATSHDGPARHMRANGRPADRRRLTPEQSDHNAEMILSDVKGHLFDEVTAHHSVFTRRQIAETLARRVEEPEAYTTVLAAVMAYDELVELAPERRNDRDEVISEAKYSTKSLIAAERQMLAAATALAEAQGHVIDARAAIAGSALALTGEQVAAVAHVTGSSRLALVQGFAGAGKTTMLQVAREAWEAAGCQVMGAALQGKAAQGLEQEAGIGSRTLHAMLGRLEKGQEQLTPRDVVVVDEAGMVGSLQIADLLSRAKQAGAKVVLVGHDKQLSPISAGAAFRTIASRLPAAELSGIRRQTVDWQREASVSFGRGRTAEALRQYDKRGHITLAATTDEARKWLVTSYLEHRRQSPEQSRVAMAHTRRDTAAINADIRHELEEGGALGPGARFRAVVDSLDSSKPPEVAERIFAVGDRVVMLQNDNRRNGLGVKRGQLGTVTHAQAGCLTVELDGGRTVRIDQLQYSRIDHGYALTVHKEQGDTVDQAFVLAGRGMSAEATHVAMTRHRQDVQLFAGRDQFLDGHALIDRISVSDAKETTADYDTGAALERHAARRQVPGRPAEASSDAITPPLEQRPATSTKEMTYDERVAHHREQIRARRRRGGTAAPDQAATPSAPPPAAKSIEEMTYEERVAHHREQIKAGRQRDPKHTQGRRPTPRR